MYSNIHWLFLMKQSLDYYFPEDYVNSGIIFNESLRITFRQFVNDVDKRVMANENSLHTLEWKVTRVILGTIAKKTKQSTQKGFDNCLNAFGAHVDRFAWLVYRKNATVQLAVGLWCHRLGWRRIYMHSKLSESFINCRDDTVKKYSLSLIGRRYLVRDSLENAGCKYARLERLKTDLPQSIASNNPCNRHL